MTGRLAVGVDIGGTKMLAVALDERGDVVASGKVPTPRQAELLLADLTRLVRDVAGGDMAGGNVAGGNVAGGNVDSVGVGVPGMGAPACRRGSGPLRRSAG